MNNTRYIFSVLVLRSKASQLVWRGLLFGALFVFGSFSLAAPARADYYAQGIVKSTNMLSGATNVTAIASVTVTATLPTNTTAKIKYSQDNVNFYNAAGTQEGYDTVAAGTNVINISALAWTNSIFYYKIELATTDSVATPVISDVQVNYTGGATPDPSATRYQRQGTLLSTNVLSGTSNVTAINSVTVTATLPGGATVGIKYSQNNVNFYNAAGVAEAYDTVAAGTNITDVSALGWTGEIFYYKLQWDTIDDATTPIISDVTVDYTGDAAAAPNCSSGCYTTGTIVSTDLMSGVERPMRGTEYFAYEISALPGGSSVTAQFSQDGTNWYDASGTLWGATTLASGDHMEYATALSLATLNWESGTSFYYKLNLSTTDSTQVPVVASAGLLFAQITIISGAQNTTNVNGLVGLWSFDGQGTTWTSSTTGTTADSSVNSHTGTLTNMSQTGSIAPGQIGQAFDFDGTDDYVSVADNAALDVGDTADFSLSGWFYRDTFTTDDTLIAKRSGIVATDIGYIVYIDDATDKLVFEVSDGTDEYSLTSTSAFTATGWNHYAIVWDQDSALGTEVYVNGVANGATDSGTIGNIGDLGNAVVLALGAESDAGNPFDGKIDETRLYNRALVATEIESLYKFGQSDEVNTGASQAQGTGRLDSGLAGYWKLDDGSGTSATDASTNSNTGTLTNGPTWTTGQIAGAVDFDGSDDSISYANNIAFDSGNFTVASWFRLDGDAGGVDGDAMIFSQRSNTVGDGQAVVNLFVRNSDDKIRAQIRDNVGSVIDKTGTTAVTQGTWYHGVMVKTSSALTLYLNGVNDGSVSHSLSGDFDANATIRYIGESYYASSGKGFLNGNIDEVRVYNRALSADEVAQLYQLTTPTGTETGLKGYWSFNGKDMSATSVYDRSGAGNTGTLTNGPAVTEGRLGQGLSFDGTNDYVNIPDSTSLSPTAAMTVSFWTNITSSISSQCRSFLAKNASGQRSWALTATTSGGVVFYVATNTNDTGTYGSTGGGLIAQNQWAYVTAVFDGAGSGNADRAKIYVNGVQSNVTFTGTIPASLTDTSQAVRFGESAMSCTALPGYLDEVRVYNRALTEAEIKSLYNTSR